MQLEKLASLFISKNRPLFGFPHPNVVSGSPFFKKTLFWKGANYGHSKIIYTLKILSSNGKYFSPKRPYHRGRINSTWTKNGEEIQLQRNNDQLSFSLFFMNSFTSFPFFLIMSTACKKWKQFTYLVPSERHWKIQKKYVYLCFRGGKFEILAKIFTLNKSRHSI